MGGICVEGENRPCNDLDACTLEQCADVGGSPSCDNSVVTVAVLLSCGLNSVVKGDFMSRDYYDYNVACNVAAPYPGKEVVLLHNGSTAGVHTVTVSSVTPAGTVYIMQMNDECDETTCAQTASMILTTTLPVGRTAFILEAPDGEAPDSLDVTLTCP
jgi:hypothetical protein